MKKFVFLILFSPLLLFWGCPVGIEYPPAKPGTEKIDKRLIGTWKCNKGEPEINKMRVEKADDYSYNVSIIDKSPFFMLEHMEYTAWVTKINKMNFIYGEAKSEKGRYYTYAYEVDGPVFTLMEFSLQNKETDGITSTEAYKTELINSMKKEDFIVTKFYYTPTSN